MESEDFCWMKNEGDSLFRQCFKSLLDKKVTNNSSSWVSRVVDTHDEEFFQISNEMVG